MKVTVEIPEGSYCYTHMGVEIDCIFCTSGEDGTGFYYICRLKGDKKRLTEGKGCIYKRPDCPSLKEE